MNNLKYYNYVYLDPSKPLKYKVQGLDLIFDYEPFYVGKGVGKRYKQHKYFKDRTFMYSKLKSLEKKGLEPIVVFVAKNISTEESCENEKYLIQVIGRRDLNKGSLVNLTNGGEGAYGRIVSQKERKIRSEQNLGKKLSVEHKNKIGLSNSKSLKGKRRFDKMKHILQLDLNKNLIREWDNIMDTQKILKINNISAVLNNRQKTAGGFIWRFKN